TTFFDYASRMFLGFSPDATELVWMSDRNDMNHLYLIDVASGTVKHPITTGDWLVRNVEQIDWEKRQVLFRCMAIHPEQDPYHFHFARTSLDGTGLTVLTEGDGTHTIEWSPEGRYFIDTWSRVDRPAVHELRDADGNRVTTLAESDVTALSAAGWKPPERFCAKGRDGTTDIYGVLWRPTNFDPTRKYPVIENIYAGPQDFHTPKSFRAYHRAQSLAEPGFVVVQCDGMGTNWRSKRFLDVSWKNLSDAGFPDRKRWITAAAQHEPAMDLTRVGIYGGSAGGQNAVAALLWHHDFYHVAVADCGCHDNRMDKIWWNELWMSWPIGPHYAEHSNTVNAHRLEGKLLLFVGELDENVDPASTMQLVDALIRADRDFDMIVIPGAGHGCAESPYGVRRRMDFFVRNLLHTEPRHVPDTAE
ncbi:MAG: prolyl oligopeptidase family serine peptidase, partial [Planctomycetia bacterium]|nr:prolyl oligopeptidase family serine peptidase [Planctomycetia bacterium]